MILRVMLAAAACAAFCSGCVPVKPTIQNYSKDGIEFSYYSNWVVQKDAPLENKPTIRSIQLSGPGHAHISFICAPASSQQKLAQYADAVAAGRKTAIEKKLTIGTVKAADVDKGTSESVVARVGGHEETGILQRFTVDVLGNPVPHEARFFMVVSGKYKVMVMTQVSQRHLESTRAAMELTLDSLRVVAPP